MLVPIRSRSMFVKFEQNIWKRFWRYFAMKFFMNRKPAVVYRTPKGSAFEMQFHLIVVNPFFKKNECDEDHEDG